MSGTTVYGGASGGDLTIEDEGSAVAGGPHSTLDFVGAGVSVADAGSGEATVTISGGGASALDDLTDVTLTAESADEILSFDGTVWRNNAAINADPDGQVNLLFDADGAASKGFNLESTGIDIRDFTGASPNNVNIRFTEDTGFVTTIANMGFVSSDDFLIENLTGAGDLILDTFSGIIRIQHLGTDHLTTIAAGIVINNELEIDGVLNHDGLSVGFYGITPTTQQTGVAVTDAAIHAALVTLGLITA